MNNTRELEKELSKIEKKLKEKYKSDTKKLREHPKLRRELSYEYNRLFSKKREIERKLKPVEVKEYRKHINGKIVIIKKHNRRKPERR